MVSIIVFVIMRVAPGNVAQMLLSGESGGGASVQEAQELNRQLGLDRPYPVQYVTFLGGLLRLDPGTSLWTKEPILRELWQRLPVTLELTLLAVHHLVDHRVADGRAVSHLPGHLGRLRVPGLHRGRPGRPGASGPARSSCCCSSSSLHWMPPLGYVSPFVNPRLNLQQFIWPALIIGYATAAILSRITRSAVLEVLREDYVRTARAKGLSGLVVVGRHVLKNALAPVVTLSAVQMGNLLGGAVVSETIFTLPGVGRFLVDAILHRDYPVVQTIVILFAAVVVMLNLLTDVLYSWFDPRTRQT